MPSDQASPELTTLCVWLGRGWVRVSAECLMAGGRVMSDSVSVSWAGRKVSRYETRSKVC